MTRWSGERRWTWYNIWHGWKDGQEQRKKDLSARYKVCSMTLIEDYSTDEEAWLPT
jgi:hypothetical protein